MEAFLVGFANKLVTVEGDNSYFLEKTADLFAVQNLMKLFFETPAARIRRSNCVGASQRVTTP